MHLLLLPLIDLGSPLPGTLPYRRSRQKLSHSLLPALSGQRSTGLAAQYLVAQGAQQGRSAAVITGAGTPLQRPVAIERQRLALPHQGRRMKARASGSRFRCQAGMCVAMLAARAFSMKMSVALARRRGTRRGCRPREFELAERGTPAMPNRPRPVGPAAGCAGSERSRRPRDDTWPPAPC